MNKNISLLFRTFVFGMSLFLLAGCQKTEPVSEEKVMEQLSSVPLSFQENKGQVDEAVKYLVKNGAATIFFTPEEVVYNMAQNEEEMLKGYVIRQSFLNANTSPSISSGEKQQGIVNYMIGDDQSKWVTGASTFGKIRYDELYAGIDLEYSGESSALKYAFEISPGIDYQQIEVKLAGIDALEIDQDGNLIMKSSYGEALLEKPYTYQEVNGQMEEIGSRYRIVSQNSYAFAVDEYDTNRTLIIDPQLHFASYWGFTGSDDIYALRVDSNGNIYTAGQTTSVSWTAMTGYDTSLNGSTDVFVTKFNDTGTSVIYSTYIGGSNADSAKGLAINGSGEAYVAGNTFGGGTAYPTTGGVVDTVASSNEGFISRLSTDGSQLLSSTFYGSTGVDSIYSLALDSSSNVYISGNTTSSVAFPLISAYDSSFSGTSDGFFAKLNSTLTAYSFSSYLGGTGTEIVRSIVADSSGLVYLTGETGSTNYPVSGGAYQSCGSGGAFLTKFSSAGNVLLYSTCFGGTGSNVGMGIDVDNSGIAAITGTTSASNFPTKNALYSTYGGSQDAFVAKFDTTLSGNASLLYSTYLGGSQTEFMTQGSLDMDTDGNVYVIGTTSSNNFPLANEIQSTFGTSTEIFVSAINPAGDTLFFSSYIHNSPTLGGNADDTGRSLAVNDTGDVWGGGSSSSTNVSTSGVVQTVKSTGTDGFFFHISTVNSVDVSGTCQQTIAGSNCVDDGTNVIKVAVNGVLQAGKEDAVVDGSWSISGVEAGAGDVVSVFIDGSAEAEEAVAVTKVAGTGSLTGMELVYKYLSIGSANSLPLNNADLALYDNGVAGENIFFEVDVGNNLNTDVEGTFENGLYVTSLGTYTPEASVSITVHGDWITDGTFNEGTSAAVFSGAAAQSLDSGVALPANITHSGSGTLTLVGGALSVTTLNNNAGIIDLNGQNLTVATTFTNSGTIRLKGTEIITLAAQDVVNGTWEYVGDGTAGPFTVKDFGADDYNNLRIVDSAGGVYNISSALLTDDLYINGATVNQTAAITVTDPSTFTLDGGATYTQTAPMDIIGNMEILNGTFTGSLTGDYIDVGANFLLTAPSAFTATNGELRVAGNFIHSGGTFSHGSGTVIMDGSLQAVSGSTSFYNFTKAAPGTDVITFADADVITINGLLTLTGVIGELLTIQSEPVGGTQWEINHQGTESVSYINLKDAGCTSAPLSTDITITNSTNTDLTSDACWVFPSVTPTDSVLGDVNIDITNSITLDISGPNPFGIAGVPLDPQSGTTTTLVRAGDAIANPDGTVSTFTMKTNNSVGGSITVSGSVANAGLLKSTSATIPNSGAGLSLSATCLAAESNTSYTGLAIRPIVSESDVSFVYDAVTSLAVKFGVDTDSTTRLWCHATGAALTLAKTVGFNNPDSGTVLKIDYLLGVIAGSGVPVGNYSETLTFTATAN